MSLGDEEYTVDQLYDMVVNPEKLKSYPGFKRALAMGISKDMAFYDDLPYEEIKGFINEEKDAIFSKIPGEVVEKSGLNWEHVGSTSIKGTILYSSRSGETILICFKL